VRPVAPLDAAETAKGGWFDVGLHRYDDGSWDRYIDVFDRDEFAAAFVPAELVDDIIAAARAACLHPVANGPRLRAAVAAYDAHIGETT